MTRPPRRASLYYPINPGKEKESWIRFTDEALPKFLDGTFAGSYQQSIIEEFESYLPSEVPWETVSGNRTFVQPVVSK